MECAGPCWVPSASPGWVLSLCHPLQGLEVNLPARDLACVLGGSPGASESFMSWCSRGLPLLPSRALTSISALIFDMRKWCKNRTITGINPSCWWHPKGTAHYFLSCVSMEIVWFLSFVMTSLLFSGSGSFHDLLFTTMKLLI